MWKLRIAPKILWLAISLCFIQQNNSHYEKTSANTNTALHVWAMEIIRFIQPGEDQRHTAELAAL
eukprot:scaffold319973_cov30-Prasinocladus_malaysianus.AAC.1